MRNTLGVNRSARVIRGHLLDRAAPTWVYDAHYGMLFATHLALIATRHVDV